jgi:hypothetical protein
MHPLAFFTMKLARLSCPTAYHTNGDTIRLDSLLRMSVEETFLTACVDASTTKFYFCELFLAVPFFVGNKKIEMPRRNGCSYKKGSLGRDMPSIGTLVGLLIRSAKRDDNYGASNIVLPCPGS